jgi:carboxymethylenebutenolidase
MVGCMSHDMPGDLEAQTITIKGHGGDEIEAYLAEPRGSGPYGGVVVIHHMPGYDRSTKEITRRFAAMGYVALMPNLYHREAPGAAPDDAAATARAQGGVPDERLVGDVAGAMAHLKSFPKCNGKVGTIGYCSGGRQSFLSAVSLQLDAAVACYPGGVVHGAPPGSPLSFAPLIGRSKDLSCPLLGLFGEEDKFPSQEEVATLDKELTSHGKDHEFHSYPGAGHAFFDVDRPSYRVEAALDGWKQVTAFFGRHLGS